MKFHEQIKGITDVMQKLNDTKVVVATVDSTKPEPAEC